MCLAHHELESRFIVAISIGAVHKLLITGSVQSHLFLFIPTGCVSAVVDQSVRHTCTATLGGFLTWVTLAEKAAHQIEEWMAQLRHQASTCSKTITLMMTTMMMTMTVTTIVTDHNMLAIQFALTM